MFYTFGTGVDEFDEKNMLTIKMKCKLFFSALDAVTFGSQIYFALKEGLTNIGFDLGWNSFVITFLGLLGRQSISILYCDGTMRLFNEQYHWNYIDFNKNPFLHLDLGWWATIAGVMMAIVYGIVVLFLIVCILGGTLLIPGVVLLFGGVISTLVLQFILICPIICTYYFAEQRCGLQEWKAKKGTKPIDALFIILALGMWFMMIAVQFVVVMAPFATKYHPWFGNDENKISFLFLEYVKTLYNFPELMTSFTFVFSADMFDPEMPQFVLFLSFLGLLIKIVEKITLCYCFPILMPVELDIEGEQRTQRQDSSSEGGEIHTVEMQVPENK